MFGLSSLKIYLYAAIALAIGGLLLRDHIVTRQRNQARAEAAQVKATITAERAARKHEQEIARNASNEFQRTVTGLQNELASRPLKPVVIRVPVRASLPESSSSTGTAPGSHAEAQGRVDGTVEKDIGPELSAFALDCQINAAQLESLQGWIRSR